MGTTTAATSTTYICPVCRQRIEDAVARKIAAHTRKHRCSECFGQLGEHMPDCRKA